MGLAERRAAKDFETNALPGLKSELAQAAGFELPVEINFESITADGYADSYRDFWTKVYFQPLVEAFKAICVDDMGKEALKSGLKKVVIQNKQGIYYGDRMATFEDGVLTLDHEPASNVDSIDERRQGIQKLLESKL